MYVPRFIRTRKRERGKEKKKRERDIVSKTEIDI